MVEFDAFPDEFDQCGKKNLDYKRGISGNSGAVCSVGRIPSL